jgi:hypothetical protein
MTLRSLKAVEAALLLLCSFGCRESEPPKAPEQLADPAPAGTALRFAGDLVLRGDDADGALVITVRKVGSKDAVLRRTYAIADPAWARRGEARCLHFGLDARDALEDDGVPIAREMELVARYDADGNPATLEAESFEHAWRARTGDLNLEYVLERPDGGLTSAARAGPR